MQKIQHSSQLLKAVNLKQVHIHFLALCFELLPWHEISTTWTSFAWTFFHHRTDQNTWTNSINPVTKDQVWRQGSSGFSSFHMTQFNRMLVLTMRAYISNPFSQSVVSVARSGDLMINACPQSMGQPQGLEIRGWHGRFGSPGRTRRDLLPSLIDPDSNLTLG